MCRALDDTAFHVSNNIATIRRHIAREISSRDPSLATHLLEEQQADDLARGDRATTLEQLAEEEETTVRIVATRHRESDRRFHEAELREEWSDDVDLQMARLRNLVMGPQNGRERIAEGDEAAEHQRAAMLRAYIYRRRGESGAAAEGEGVDRLVDPNAAGIRILDSRTEEQRQDAGRRMQMQIQFLRDSRTTIREGEEVTEIQREWQREHDEALRRMETWAHENDWWGNTWF